MMRSSILISLSDPSREGDVRRTAQHLAYELGFDETRTGKLSIVCNELSSNLTKHARSGQILIRAIGSATNPGIEILSLDKGPGISNIGQCLEDGYSTAGSAGTGLGAVRRMADLFEIHSLPGVGTAILAQVFKSASTSGTPDSHSGDYFEVSALSVPIRGEQVCGDSWAVHFEQERGLFFVADGLGHGPGANEAAEEAVRVFGTQARTNGVEIVRATHEALRKTRGAAISVAEITLSGRVLYTGVGNVAGAILATSSNSVQRMVSQNGTAGIASPRPREFEYQWSQDSVLLMYSDGLVTHWSLDKYLGLLNRHPSLIAGVLLRDFSRGSDDTTVLVAKVRRPA